MKNYPAPEDQFDVAVVGGALSGAAAALLLLREKPGLRVLIIEKSQRFTRRVGEATVELSAFFLGRALGLTHYLNEEHLVKQGLRFWFSNGASADLAQCSEIGGRYLARVPAYQVDRSTLDEEVLGRAGQAGATLWRPAQVTEVKLKAGEEQVLEVRCGEELRQVRARWVIDASGVAALLARQSGWLQVNGEHPTTSVWSRWKGVKDWDGAELAAKYPCWAMECYGIRGTATNHFMGDGWWAWCIPLKGGDVSVGVVFDQRLVDWPQEGSLGERLKTFLCGHPAAREILSQAQWQEGDVHWRKNLPYSCRVTAGDGFVLVGDAAGFTDPFYSPGMDWVAFTVSRAVELVMAQMDGGEIGERIERHNRDFSVCYQRWFEALYKDKYYYLGDYELMRLAFLLDLGLYYFGVASQPFRRGMKALKEPPFASDQARPAYYFMSLYNRRFARMARMRRLRGQWGRRNSHERFMFGGFTFSRSSAWPIVKAMAAWFWLEATEGWRSWFRRTLPEPGAGPEPAVPPSPVSLDKNSR
jgi:flavin-dependent dehydrogenase